MGLLDHSTSNAALIWHTTAGAVSTVRALPLLARADVTLVTAATVNTATADDDRSAVVSVSENVTVAACFAGDVEGEDDDEEEVTAVPGDLSASAQVMTEASMEVSTTSGDAHLSVTSATASTSSTAAAEHSSHHSSYGPESCAGGNAVTLHSPSAEKVICAICSHVEKHHREGRCFEVTTVEDKSAGPVSSWVDKTHINADPVPSSAAGAPTDTSNTTSAADRVQVIKVPQRCFIFGHIAYTAAPHSGPCPENKEFSNDLRTQIDRIRAAVAASDAACSHAPGTLLLVTAQESLHPVLALIKRKRLLGKATMAAAMWSAEEELFLKDRRKHNLAYMSATII